jgi:low affinity Fe/Cu permease
MEVSTIIGIIIGVLYLVATLILIIYIYAYTFKTFKEQNQAILEIKSKIGSMIRDINTTNKQDFTVDMEQQQSINNIMSRLKR